MHRAGAEKAEESQPASDSSVLWTKWKYKAHAKQEKYCSLFGAAKQGWLMVKPIGPYIHGFVRGIWETLPITAASGLRHFPWKGP